MSWAGAQWGLWDLGLQEGAGGLVPPNHPHVPAVSTQLDPFAAIDHSLLERPAITAEHGDVALKVMSSRLSLDRLWDQGTGGSGLSLVSVHLSVQGEFFRVGKCQQGPSSALPMALPVAWPAALPTVLPMAQEPMLLLAITEFVANSAAFTYFTAGALRRNISSNMVRMAPAVAVGRASPLPGSHQDVPTPSCALWYQRPDQSAAFQLPRRFPLQLRTKSMGLFSPQVGTGWGVGHAWDRTWAGTGCR